MFFMDSDALFCSKFSRVSYECVGHHRENNLGESSSEVSVRGQGHGLSQGLPEWLCSHGVPCDQPRRTWGTIIVYH